MGLISKNKWPILMGDKILIIYILFYLGLCEEGLKKYVLPKFSKSWVMCN
jgi:hypothetical protein